MRNGQLTACWQKYAGHMKVAIASVLRVVEWIMCRGASVKKLGINPPRATKLAWKLHAHSVQIAQQLTSTGRAIENKDTQHISGSLGLYADRNPPDSHYLPSYPLVRETHGSLGQCTKQNVTRARVPAAQILSVIVQGRLFSPGWCVPILGEHCGCDEEATVRRAPVFAFALMFVLQFNPAGCGVAQMQSFVEDVKTVRGHHPNAFAVSLASSLLNPCLSRLERARSAVGRRRLGLLCWASNSCMRWWEAPGLRGSCISGNMHIQCRCEQQCRCLLVESQLS
eukprot:1151181-Pelagomonas_calceolata.AAC.11